MESTTISYSFNRALSKTLDGRKLLLVFLVSLFCGLLVIFFKGVSLHAGSWAKKSLLFLPIFLCAGIMLSTGIILIRVYHDEVKGRRVSYKETMAKSWDIVIGSTYFSLPIILCYLLLWMMMGLFLLFEQVPLVGTLFSVILAFGPFLLNVASLCLCIINAGLLFYATPALALKGLDGVWISKNIVKKLKHDLFANITLALLALVPLLIILSILLLAAFMSEELALSSTKPLYITLRWFFVMIPFVACLTPAIIFFFNFSAEAHVFLMKQIQGTVQKQI